MKLNVLERVTLMGLLPAEGNLITYRVLSDFRKALSFTEKEIKDFKIVQKDGRIFWGKSVDKDIAIGEQVRIIVETALQKLDKEGKVNDGNISLFEKFPLEEVKK
jgi:hypothetical protein